MPVFIVQHIGSDGGEFMCVHLTERSIHMFTLAVDKMLFKPGNVYLAPSGYHLLIDNRSSLSLSVDEKVCYSRPSIDVLFESAAFQFGNTVLAVVLTGANVDGTKGAQAIKSSMGVVIAQSPDTAEVPVMPKSVVDAGFADIVLPLDDIAKYIIETCCDSRPVVSKDGA